MKKFLFILTAVSLYGNISDIISYIKNMESYTHEFKKIANYNVFSDTVVKESDKLKVNKNTNLTSPSANEKFTIYAVFQNKININGQWYKAGDIVYGYKIVKITGDNVLLKRDNNIKMIEFKTNIIKVVK